MGQQSVICSRCHGLLVTTWLMDVAGATHQFWLPAWRCVGCGAITDPGIVANRQGNPHPQRCRARLRVNVRSLCLNPQQVLSSQIGKDQGRSSTNQTSVSQPLVSETHHKDAP